MAAIKLLLAIFKAVPILKGIWDDLSTAWVTHKIAEMKEENREAIRKAMNEHDQRSIEQIINSPKAGQPSGIPGTDIIDPSTERLPNT